MDRILSGVIPGHSEPGGDDNEGVLRIPLSSSFTSTVDCFVSYPEHALWGVLPLCRETVGVTTPADKATRVVARKWMF